jgi:molecular chaperone GrpE
MQSSHASDEHAQPAAEEPQPDLAEQLAATEDRFKRALADLDNYRKRAGRETDRRVAEARESLLRDWLEALDSVERAIAMDPSLADGLGAVLRQMEAILARHGVHRIGEPGEPFDPERHEAVAVRETDEAPDRSVVDVMRSGYASDGRVLRPAQVAVARAARTGSDSG